MMGGLAATYALWRTKPSGFSLGRWRAYSQKWLASASNDEGLVRCGCNLLGFRHCGYSRRAESMRVHYTPRLTVALTPECYTKNKHRVDYEIGANG